MKYCREQTTPKRVLTFVCDTGTRYLTKVYSDGWMVDQGLLGRVGDGGGGTYRSRPRLRVLVRELAGSAVYAEVLALADDVPPAAPGDLASGEPQDAASGTPDADATGSLGDPDAPEEVDA